jgi:hypothetical protein
VASSHTDVQAAPPDDGGEQGSFTQPADALQTRNVEQTDRTPPLHHDANWGRPAKKNAWLPIVIALVVLLLIFAVVFGTTSV